MSSKPVRNRPPAVQCPHCASTEVVDLSDGGRLCFACQKTWTPGGNPRNRRWSNYPQR